MARTINGKMMGRGKQFLYVSCGGQQEIVCFDMDPQTGSLSRRAATRLPGAAGARSPDASSPLATIGAPLAASSDGAVLYAAIRAEPFRVISYRIEPASGALTPIGEAPLPGGMVYLSLDPGGRFLLGAAFYEALASASRIEADGAIRAPAEWVGGMEKGHSIVAHPTGRLAYVGATRCKQVQTLHVDRATGKLARAGLPVRNAEAEGTPRHLAFHPYGPFLYAIHETSGIVDVYAAEATGRLTCIQSVDRRPPGERANPGIGADLRITPDGRFLYATERAHDTIAAYAIDPATGLLTHVQTLAAQPIPRSLAIDRASRHLVAAGQGTDCVTVYAIAADGHLDRVAQAATGPSPIWVQIVETGAGRGD